MRNNVATVVTTATLIASQLAVPAMPQATTLPYPPPGGPQIQPPRPGYGDGFAGTIRCESRSNRYQQCNVATKDRVELVRRLGGRCNAGRQWGYTANYVWVNNGCRAEFGYGYRNVRPPEKDKDKGPSTGLIIGGIVVAGGLLALLASQSKKKKAAAG